MHPNAIPRNIFRLEWHSGSLFPKKKNCFAHHVAAKPIAWNWLKYILLNAFFGLRKFASYKNSFRPGSAPDPAGGAHDTPSDPLVGYGGGYRLGLASLAPWLHAPPPPLLLLHSGSLKFTTIPQVILWVHMFAYLFLKQQQKHSKLVNVI